MVVLTLVSTSLDSTWSTCVPTNIATFFDDSLDDTQINDCFITSICSYTVPVCTSLPGLSFNCTVSLRLAKSLYLKKRRYNALPTDRVGSSCKNAF